MSTVLIYLKLRKIKVPDLIIVRSTRPTRPIATRAGALVERLGSEPGREMVGNRQYLIR